MSKKYQHQRHTYSTCSELGLGIIIHAEILYQGSILIFTRHNTSNAKLLLVHPQWHNPLGCGLSKLCHKNVPLPLASDIPLIRLRSFSALNSPACIHHTWKEFSRPIDIWRSAKVRLGDLSNSLHPWFRWEMARSYAPTGRFSFFELRLVQRSQPRRLSDPKRKTHRNIVLQDKDKCDKA